MELRDLECATMVGLPSNIISRAPCSLFREKRCPRARRKDGKGQTPGAGDSPKASQGDVEDPGSFRCHQNRTKEVPQPLQKSESPSRCKGPQGEGALPGVCKAAAVEVKFFPKPGLQQSLCWHRKQSSGESRSHLHFKVSQESELTGLQILLGTAQSAQHRATPMGKLLRSSS